MERPFPAYEGTEPFIFVCYAHDDAALVYPEIVRLREAGFHVWYDEGITPGSEWSATLADRIQRCAVFLYYVTPRSVEREHCRREVNFALEQRCAILPVQLERTGVPAALQLSLSHRQAILKFEYPLEAYERKLDKALEAAASGRLVVEDEGKPRRLEIGDWVLEVGSQRLQRGDAEAVIDPKDLSVLLHLAEAAPDPVTTDALLDRSWPGVVVGDNALHQVIGRLRRALGDNARKPRYIETLPKRGYRLMVPVAQPRAAVAEALEPAPVSAAPIDTVSPGGVSRAEPEVDATIEPPASERLMSRWPVLVAGLAALLTLGAGLSHLLTQSAGAEGDSPRISVRPAEVAGSDPDLEAFASVVEAGLLDALYATDVQVVFGSETSAVDYLVQSRLRSAGTDSGKIWLGIVRTSDGRLVWSQERKTKLSTGDQFDQASYFARVIAMVVLIDTIPVSTTDSEAAIEAWKKANIEWVQVAEGQGDCLAFEAHVQEALRADPDFANALFYATVVYKNRLCYTRTWRQSVERAHLYAEKLVRQQPEWTFQVGSVNMMIDLDFESALKNYQYAIDAAVPGDSTADIEIEMIGALAYQGDIELAVRRLEAAKRRSPLVNRPYLDVGLAEMYLLLGRYEDALSILERTATLASRSMTMAANHKHKVEALYSVGEVAAAEEALEIAWQHLKDARPEMLVGVMALLGRRERAETLIEESEARFQRGELPQMSEVFWGAYRLGKLDEAFTWLDRAIENREYWFLPAFHRSAELDPIRNHPRFLAAQARLEEIQAEGSPIPQPELSGGFSTASWIGLLLIFIGGSAAVFLFVRRKAMGRSAPRSRLSVALFSAESNDSVLIQYAPRLQAALQHSLSSSSAHSAYDVVPDDTGPDFVVRGSLARAGESVRVTLRLVDARSATVWSKMLDFPADPSAPDFDRYVEYLGNSIAILAPQWPYLVRQTRSAAARAEFVKGFMEFQDEVQGVGGSLRASVAHYEEAIRLDPKFLAAIRQLGIQYKNRLNLTLRYEEAVAKAHECAERVLALDPRQTFLMGTVNSFLDLNYPAAHENLSNALSFGWARGEVEREIGLVCLSQGNLEEGLEHLLVADELGAATNRAVVAWDLARAYLAQGRYQQADRAADMALARLQDSPFLHAMALETKVWTAHFSGKIDQAKAALDLGWSGYGEERPWLFAGTLALLGDGDRARDVLKDAEERYLAGSLSTFYHCFWGHFFLDEYEKALLWLERSIKNREFALLPMLKRSPILESFRAHAGFQQAMDLLGEIESQKGSPYAVEPSDAGSGRFSSGGKVSKLKLAAVAGSVTALAAIFVAANLDRETETPGSSEPDRIGVRVGEFSYSSSEAEALGESLGEEIARRLSLLPSFSVSLGELASEVAQQTAVEITGAVRQLGESSLNVLVRFADPRTSQLLWVDEIEVPADDLNLALRQVGSRASLVSKVRFDPAWIARFGDSVPSDREALIAFFRGTVALRSVDPAQMDMAIAQLEQAVELAPDFAGAWTMRNAAYHVASNYGLIDRLAAYAQISEGTKRALESDPDFPTARLWNANLLLKAGELEAAMDTVRSVIQDHPAHTDYQLIESLAICGHLEEALDGVERMLKLDPDDQIAEYNRIMYLWMLNRHVEAERYANALLARDPGDHRAQIEISRVLRSRGKTEEALALHPFSDRLLPAFQQGGEAALQAEMLNLAREVESSASNIVAGSAWEIYVQAYALMGEPEQAVAWLEKGYALDPYEVLWYRQLPLPGMAEVRAHPAYRELMQRTVGSPESCPGAESR